MLSSFKSYIGMKLIRFPNFLVDVSYFLSLISVTELNFSIYLYDDTGILNAVELREGMVMWHVLNK